MKMMQLTLGMAGRERRRMPMRVQQQWQRQPSPSLTQQS
jgi:hypothetical protein